MEIEPKVELGPLAVDPARVESCVGTVLAQLFPLPSLWDAVVWAGRYVLAAGIVLAVAAWMFGAPRQRTAPPPGPVPTYAPMPDDALLSLSARGEVDVP